MGNQESIVYLAKQPQILLNSYICINRSIRPNVGCSVGHVPEFKKKPIVIYKAFYAIVPLFNTSQVNYDDVTLCFEERRLALLMLASP